MRDRNVFFFFYVVFLSRTFTNHRTAGKGGGYFINSSLPIPPASQTLTAESSPLHIASGRTRTERKSLTTKPLANNFNTLTLKQIFWKKKNFLKKLECRFLVENTKIENASLPYKTAISEANVIANKMVCTQWIHDKDRSFASSHFINFENFASFKNLLH